MTEPTRDARWLSEGIDKDLVYAHEVAMWCDREYPAAPAGEEPTLYAACPKCGEQVPCEYDCRPAPTPDLAAVRDAWVIWSHEHAAYWRAERRGYTVALVAAGVYSEAEAKAIAAEVSRDPSKLNEARSLASELARCGQGTVATLLRPAPLPAEVRAAVERVRFQQAAGCPASLEDIDTLLAHLTREAR